MPQQNQKHREENTQKRAQAIVEQKNRPSFIVMVNFLLYHEFRNKQKLLKEESYDQMKNIVIFIRTDLSHTPHTLPLLDSSGNQHQQE